MKTRSRRWFLAKAAALGGPALIGACRIGAEPLVSATGTAFGTEVGLSFLPPAPDAGLRLVEKAFEEMARIESLFTLMDPASPLRRLNATGELLEPPGEFVELLNLCDRVHRLTGGAFDPTVQPLWELYESHFATQPLDRRGPLVADIAAARALVGWERVEVDETRVHFARPGMKMTLNGVVPGFAADAVADLLSSEGVVHALVDCGEYRSIGVRPDGDPWRVEIRGPGDGEILGHVEMNGNAVATSAGYATAFDLEERFHHLFHPKADTFQPADRVIVVEAPKAALADALATAGGVMDWDHFSRCVANLDETSIYRYPGDPVG